MLAISIGYRTLHVALGAQAFPFFSVMVLPGFEADHGFAFFDELLQGFGFSECLGLGTGLRAFLLKFFFFFFDLIMGALELAMF